MRISAWSSDVCSSNLKADWLEGKWSGIKVASGDARRGETAVDVDQLKRIGSRLCDVLDGFSLNSKLNRFIEERRKAVETGEGVARSFGEEVAFRSEDSRGGKE